MSDLFIDRLDNIVTADGVARLDFLRLSALDAEKKRARMVPSLRLAIPLAGLMEVIVVARRGRVNVVRQAQAGTAPAPSTPEFTISAALTVGLAGLPKA